MPGSGTVLRARTRIDQVPLPCLNAQSLPELRRASNDEGWMDHSHAGFATFVFLPGYYSEYLFKTILFRIVQ